MQASTSTLRALSTGHAPSTYDGILGLFKKEVGASSVIAALSGVILFFVSYLWSGSAAFGSTTAFSAFLNCCGAGAIGALVN